MPAANGHERIVKLLLATSEIDPVSEVSDERTPPPWAAEKGGEMVVYLLLETKGIDHD